MYNYYVTTIYSRDFHNVNKSGIKATLLFTNTNTLM